MRKDKERGAIVVEATISLTAFVFAIFTILSLVNIYFIQARMSIALNAAAKEISQYSYLYYALGVNDLDTEVSADSAEHRELAKNTIDGVGSMLNTLSGIENDLSTKNFEEAFEKVNEGKASATSLINQYKDIIGDDPKAFILGIGKMALVDLKEEGKAFLAQVLAKAFMEKNLKAYQKDDPDVFLKRYNVVDGMDGLDFNYSTLMAYGESDLIQLVVTYDVSVIKLLNMDFKFTFRQCAKTSAWGTGIKLITAAEGGKTEQVSKPTVWDNPSSTERGKIIVLEEKKYYTYVTTGRNFDAYNNANGANEFVHIMSIDTHLKSYQTADKIKNAIFSKYSKLKTDVGALDETIKVETKSGETVTLNSTKETRTYKMVVVIPADSDMTIVNEAVKKFKEDNPGVVIEINTDYGSPTPQKEENNEENK